jgi:nitroimidazol reductase NimA-like FMN-containing flavoprotein (pyridoxamine 5'-phosphate oxidase superfamily)
MTDAEAHAYLREQCKVVVVTLQPDCMPHPMPMYYGVDEAGRIVITTFAKSQKVKNIERDPRATLLVETGVAYHDIRSVIAYCDAEIISDPEEVRANMSLIRTGKPVATGEMMQGQVRSSMTKRVIIRFTPYKFVSWDHSKLGELY